MATPTRRRCALTTCGRPAHLEDTLCLGHRNTLDRLAGLAEPIDDDELAALWEAGELYVTDAPAGFHEALMEALNDD